MYIWLFRCQCESAQIWLTWQIIYKNPKYVVAPTMHVWPSVPPSWKIIECQKYAGKNICHGNGTIVPLL